MDFDGGLSCCVAKIILHCSGPSRRSLPVSIIVRPDDVRRQNQFGILMALRRNGNLSRTELSAATGLSASTVTVITNSLMERDVLTAEQVGEPVGQRRGRPQVRLLPNPRYASIVIMRLALNMISAD